MSDYNAVNEDDFVEEEDQREVVVNDEGVVEKQAGKAIGKGTEVGAISNLVCTCVGSGLLALPSAIADSGYIGVFVVIITAFLASITAKMLTACQHPDESPSDHHHHDHNQLHHHPKRLNSYGEIGQYCFGLPGKIIVLVFQMATLFGVCTIFLILAAGNLLSVTSSFIPFTIHDWVLLIGVFLIPFSWIKTLKEVSYLAFFGVVASLLVGMLAIIFGLKSWADPWTAPDHFWVTSLGGLSVSFNTVVFSFGGHSVIPTIEANMARPLRFKYVANVAYLLIGGVYASVGLVGYLGWGSDVKGNVLQNMEGSSEAASVVIIMAKLLITMHVIFAYPIPLNPINLALEEYLQTDKLPESREFRVRIVLRSVVVLLTILLATLVPYFGAFLSLVGALSIIAMIFVLPVVLYWKIHGHTLSNFQKVLLTLILLFGIFSTVLGVYYSIEGLIDAVKSCRNPFNHFFVPSPDSC